MNRVRDLIEQQKSHAEWLEKKGREFQKKVRLLAHSNPLLAKDLQRLAQRIEDLKRSTCLDLSRRWKHNSGFILAIKGHEELQQERQLDGQFQIRLGALFRSFMPKNPLPKEKEARGPSLRTVARLVVLFLVCADLASVEDDYARLKYNNRRITVDGVLQQLRGAGIDNK